MEEKEFFITTWQTTTDNESITIPTIGGGYNYTIRWDDSNIDERVTGSATFTYKEPGIHTIKIGGQFPRIYFNNKGNKDKMLSIEQWGSIQWETFTGAFYGCSNLILNTLDVPDLSRVSDMSFMFAFTKKLNSGLSKWNVENVTNMSNMFLFSEGFNADISDWNVVNVENMSTMFRGAVSFNRDLSKWGDKVAKVTDMSSMFYGAKEFNENISNWNVSRVIDMSFMFSGAEKFNIDISDWNVVNVENMSAMFQSASSFSVDISEWQVNKVTDMSFMFSGTEEFNADLSKWKDKLGKVTTMKGMFQSTKKFNADISEWDVNNVTDMSVMFSRAEVFNADISRWNVSRVVDMGTMFQSTKKFNADISEWDVSKVKNMSVMFSGAEEFNADLSKWKDKLWNVTTMKGMFQSTKKFNADISEWNVSNVTNMRFMFSNSLLFDRDIGNWNVENVKDMGAMFNNSKLSTTNYDALLIGWSKLTLEPNVGFDGGRSNYCKAEEARAEIIRKYKWGITDDGKDLLCGKQIIDVYTSTITAQPTEVIADGVSVSTITVQLLDTNGVKVTEGGETVTIKTTLGNLSNVTDNLNGTYTATLSSTTSGKAEVSFSIKEEDSTNKANVSFVEDTESFITTWQTITDNESITIPTRGSEYNYTVDWGDGFTESELRGNATHIYAKPGIYTVKIKGSFPQIFFNNQGDKDKILTIEQWGIIQWKAMNNAFHGCSNLTSNASDAPDLSLVTTTYGMFNQATSFNADLNDWDVSNVTNMSLMFAYASIFNGDISNWDVKSSKYMSGMFWHASMFNQDISNWNVSGVIDMSLMFYFAVKFNKDLSKWNEKVSQVELMGNMFGNAILFDGNIGGWNVNNVTHMSSMFNGAKAFNSDISNWNVSKVENMNFMFSGAISFNRDLSKWNVSKVTNMRCMFQGAKKFNANLNDWNVSEVTDMDCMFASASEFSSDLYKWKDKLGKVERMSQMFSNTEVFNSDISTWDVSNVIDMNAMFFNAKSFNQDISNWNVGNVTNMHRMFMSASSFDQDIGDWNVSNVIDMSEMFKSAKLSTENYDASLIGWSKQKLQENVPFDGGNSNYCDGEKAREDIISKFNWTITDSGRDIACVQLDLTKSTITALPQNVNINKGKSSLITVQLKDELGNSFTRSTELVSIASTKGVVNTIQNLGNGLYQTQLRDDSVGTAIVSYKVGEENGIQNALVSFYKPLGCQIAFNIKADQDITGAKGRYRLVSNSEARSETSWNVFDILDFNNSLTPLIREEGEYQLEVMIKGLNGVWTDWYSHSSFIINDCQAVEGASVEVYKGDCKAVIRGKIKLFFENNDAGIKLYKDASLRIPFDGNDESYVVLDEVSESDASREVAVVKTVVFNVSNEGIVSNLRPCSLGDVSDNVEDES
ncbi:BspA family leucine-rich repeat surface protein [Tenacibaculum sp. M341]|uniref:BspA family leucine-rich repeat surface protein n=1 Tax=Tenacibaculum sp. M341 TaxID=2530339 RepID=UPI001046DD5E|nr:BspA family leucine-rich repeat surface protein [Tenacibaculum sp. M341]TCI93216.1 BspA family leucine-rich repeat surface protein [Tenacibaculum sp. M341]